MVAIVTFINGTLGLGTGFTSGGVLIEPPSSAGYVRQSSVTMSNFTAGTGYNDAQVNFGVPAVAWGSLTSWALFDGNGNQVFVGALLNTIQGNTGQNVMVPVGYISLTLAPAAG